MLSAIKSSQRTWAHPWLSIHPRPRPVLFFLLGMVLGAVLAFLTAHLSRDGLAVVLTHVPTEAFVPLSRVKEGDGVQWKRISVQEKGTHATRLPRGTNTTSLPRVVLYVLVKSAPRNSERRSSCRSAWQWRSSAGDAHIHGLVVQAFVIGKAIEGKDYEKVNKNVLKEQKRFGDIVLYPRNDTYLRLTWKVLWGLGHALKSYDFDMLLYCDDDAFVNFPPIFTWIGGVLSSSVYAGYPIMDAPVIHTTGSRWTLTRKEWPSDYYTPYCPGAGYVLSRDVVEAVHLESLRRRSMLWIEDVFVGFLVNATGLVRRPSYIPVYSSPDDKVKGMFCCEPSPYVLIASDLEQMNKLAARQERHEPLCLSDPKNEVYCR